MALKAVLQNLDGVPESLRSEYKEHEGKFYLDVDGIDDHHAVGALRRAKDYEKDEARTAKGKIATLSTQIESLTTELADLRKSGIPKGDVEALETSYKTKYATKEAELNQRIEKLTKSLEGHLLDGNAMKLANEIAAKPEYVELLMPHIRHRLKLEDGEDGAQIVRILDKDGKPSASNLDDFKKELMGNKAFSAILTGSKASGGGASGGGGSGGGAPSGKKLSEMTSQERIDFQRADPTGFNAAVEASKLEARKGR